MTFKIPSFGYKALSFNCIFILNTRTNVTHLNEMSQVSVKHIFCKCHLCEQITNLTILRFSLKSLVLNL